jgi:hypothetical protein
MICKNETYIQFLYVLIDAIVYMNTADFHLVVRNDSHCPTCRMWYFKVYKSNLQQSGNVIWVDEWVRRRNGDKYQTITIIKDKIYNLSNYSLESGNDIGAAAVTHAVVFISVDKSKWCPDNIVFSISFHENIEGAAKVNDSFSGEYDENIYSYVIELKDNEEICLNDLCNEIQPNVW